MAFFKQFPITQYNTLGDGIINDIVDMYRHVDVNEILIDDASTYTFYEISDGERPDTVSSRLYGTPDYYWTFFVVNESLKAGLNSWPLEYNQFRECIESEYGKYSVMIFAPIQKRAIVNGVDTLEHIDYLGGLNLTHVEIVDDNNGATAQIHKYDVDSLQLWVYDVSDTSFYEKKTFTLRYTQNMDEDSDLYITERVKWLKEAYEWTRKNQPFTYDSFTRFTNFEELNLTFDTPEYYEYFYENHFRNIVFKTRIIHPQAYNAAKYYLDADFEEPSIISGYQAYNLEYDLGELEIEPYNRGRLETYDKNYHAGFTKGNVTDVTSNTYTNTYTIGSYGLYRPDPVSTSISYLEHEEEENFNARKIRVIRKDLIDAFVERYKELIQS